ncbi:hypothetical protein B7486_70055, partial [cyanobacterium TDX16]
MVRRSTARLAPTASAALVLGLGLVLAACGSDGSTEAAPEAPADAAGTSDDSAPDEPEEGSDDDAEDMGDDQLTIDLDDDELSAVMNDLADEVTPLPVGGTGSIDPADRQRIEDASGTLAFEAPGRWKDVRDVDTNRDGGYIGISPDFESFESTWDTPVIAYYET